MASTIACLARVVAALDPLRELDLLRGREQRHLADVLEEELQRVGRDLGLGRPRRARASASSSASAVDDLDLLLVERGVERVELAGVEVELVERERELVRVEPPARATGSRAGPAPRRSERTVSGAVVLAPLRIAGAGRSGPPPFVACADTVATSRRRSVKDRAARSVETPAAVSRLVEVAARLAGERRAGLDARRARELRFASLTSPDQSSSRPRWKRTVAALAGSAA